MSGVLRYLSLILLLMTTSFGFAQIELKGQSVNDASSPKSFLLHKKVSNDYKRVRLPAINIEKLLAEDAAFAKTAKAPLPLRFAVKAKDTFDLTDGTWQELPDSEGRLWQLSISSPGAKSMNLGFSRFDLPDKAQLWIYDPERTQTKGPYTNRHRSPSGGFWAPIIQKDEVVIELFIPADVTEQPNLEVGYVNQGYRDISGVQSGLTGLSEAPCNNDVICHPNTLPYQVFSVGAYTFQSASGTLVCSGTLLNNTNMDKKPYFLTANHCIPFQGSAASVVAYWLYQSKSDPNGLCDNNGNGPHDPTQYREHVGGATLRAGWGTNNQTTSDFSLLEFNIKPETCVTPTSDPCYAAARYAGWDAINTAPSEAIGIHHPKGDAKAMSFSNSVTNVSNFPNMWKVSFYDGITEQGSSGSCLFASDPNDQSYGRCIGQLNGWYGVNPENDPNNDLCAEPHNNQSRLYGRFSKSWYGNDPKNGSCNNESDKDNSLRCWLDPAAIIVPTDVNHSGMSGDPHITTTNGIHYDFQGAGEYIALKDSNGLEIQTRQSPVATTFQPGANPYHGLATCVSINSAVAARVGKHKVSYQPKTDNDNPDQHILELRVDGRLIELEGNGLDLEGGGRIIRTAAQDGIQIEFPDRSNLTITPGWWQSQRKWHMNLSLERPGLSGIPDLGDGETSFSRPAAGGLMAAVDEGDWLPKLPDGSSLGKMPDCKETKDCMHQRYVDLYNNFGEKWRVTSENSLFNYEDGTSPDHYVDRDWPREHGPCLIEGKIAAESVSEAVAEETCRFIADKTLLANCKFDVQITGNLGFAETYVQTQQLQSGATTISVADDKDPTRKGDFVSFTAEVKLTQASANLKLSGTVQFILDGKEVGVPTKLDEAGRAMWKTSDLKIGQHVISAKFLPDSNSGLVASVSSDETHTVIDETIDWFVWLVAFLVFILIMGIVLLLRQKNRK